MIVSKIPQILDHEVVALTKVLAGIELKKADPVKWDEKLAVADVINISGCFKVRIMCEATKKVFHRIISAMYGGGLPPEGERTLYINEYMNIVCGQIVSKLNDLTGERLKLSVPEYYKEGTAMEQTDGWTDSEILTYYIDQDLIRFTIHYVIQKNGGEIS